MNHALSATVRTTGAAEWKAAQALDAHLFERFVYSRSEYGSSTLLPPLLGTAPTADLVMVRQPLASIQAFAMPPLVIREQDGP